MNTAQANVDVHADANGNPGAEWIATQDLTPSPACQLCVLHKRVPVCFRMVYSQDNTLQGL
jgi:hypothetical protein